MDDKVIHRKAKWTYSPPAIKRWTLESRIPHPTNGSRRYGVMPQLIHNRVTIFAGGDIVLRYGRHMGSRFSHDGFGFKHIWARRFHHILEHDAAVAVVSGFVASIIRPGAAIHWEVGKRVALFCSKNGEAVVEERGAAEAPFYSVVTAINHPVKAKGSRLGALG